MSSMSHSSGSLETVCVLGEERMLLWPTIIVACLRQ